MPKRIFSKAEREGFAIKEQQTRIKHYKLYTKIYWKKRPNTATKSKRQWINEEIGWKHRNLENNTSHLQCKPVTHPVKVSRQTIEMVKKLALAIRQQ